MKRSGRETLTSGLLVVLSGPSGVGKGTVVAQAMSLAHPGAGRLRRSISVTTRPRRAEERDGVDYFFVTPEEFDRRSQAGALLEWATYLDNRYGTPAGWVDDQLAAGSDVVLEIEVKGAMQVKDRRPEAVLVYMLPPSWEELTRRLEGRRSESEEVQKRRIDVAREEIRSLPHYHYAITNAEVEQAARDFLALLSAEHARVSRVDVSYLLDGSP